MAIFYSVLILMRAQKFDTDRCFWPSSRHQMLPYSPDGHLSRSGPFELESRFAAFAPYYATYTSPCVSIHHFNCRARTKKYKGFPFIVFKAIK